MKRLLFPLLLLLTALGAAAQPAPERPNIVFILADDLGYADLGCYGQKYIRTPNIDRLAAEGMRFTRHYAGNAVCAPSRCVLMTGKHPGHAAVRNNVEVQPEGNFPLPAGTVTVASLLKKQGYTTGAFGKWGLGPPASTGDPLKNGFDRFFGYLCQRHAHNFYPTYLWDNDKHVELKNPAFSAHQKFPVGADPNSPESYKGYTAKEYAPDVIGEQARRFVRDNKDRPFFLYFPTTVPHVALQVPEESRTEYRGKLPDKPYLGDQMYLPQQYPHAAYAAMVTRMDREVGHLVQLVRELGLEKKTLFVFTSDNGGVYERVGGADSDFFKSNGNLRAYKGSLYEGGVRVPMIARWPGRIQPGTTSDRVTGFEDWLPTLVELAGGKDPKNVDGISLLPTLFGNQQDPRPFLYREFAAYGGQQALWVGDWKAIRQKLMPARNNAPIPPIKTEFYNLKDDLTESSDVAAQHPDVLARLERTMRAQHTPSSDFPMPALDRLLEKRSETNETGRRLTRLITAR